MKKTKIDLPEELLCAYVDGTTTPQEDREMMAMLASDKGLALLHDDLKTVMDIIGTPDEDIEVEAYCSIALDEEPMTRLETPLPGAGICRGGASEDAAPAPSPTKAPRFDSSLFDRFRSFKSSKSTASAQSRITPYMVRRLQPNEIFVFGSNPWGLHNGGASKLAKTKFGAIQGQGEGPQGQSYAIPTIVGGVEKIRPHVDQFIEYAEQHPELHFLVSRVGCGTAGFKPEDIAPLFIKAKDLTNVSLPNDFWKVIGLP